MRRMSAQPNKVSVMQNMVTPVLVTPDGQKQAGKIKKSKGSGKRPTPSSTGGVAEEEVTSPVTNPDQQKQEPTNSKKAKSPGKKPTLSEPGVVESNELSPPAWIPDQQKQEPANNKKSTSPKKKPMSSGPVVVEPNELSPAAGNPDQQKQESCNTTKPKGPGTKPKSSEPGIFVPNKVVPVLGNPDQQKPGPANSKKTASPDKKPTRTKPEVLTPPSKVVPVLETPNQPKQGNSKKPTSQEKKLTSSEPRVIATRKVVPASAKPEQQKQESSNATKPKDPGTKPKSSEPGVIRPNKTSPILLPDEQNGGADPPPVYMEATEDDVEPLDLPPGENNVGLNYESNLLFDILPTQTPIIYSPEYNIRFCAIQWLHPFDVSKWKHVHKKLLADGTITKGQCVEPRMASFEDLRRVHTKEYLDSLKIRCVVSKIAEVGFLGILPKRWLEARLLKPLRYQVGGSILGTKLALERGWAINLGGGFHHCTSEKGQGFCFYADITLCVKFLLDAQQINSVMIIDLDAHQGNGYARDLKKHPQTFILDIFNSHIYPMDKEALEYCNCPVPLKSYVKDLEYIKEVKTKTKICLEVYEPEFVIYNAGTDVLKNDPLGHLAVTRKAVIDRDLSIFAMCRSREIPILMLTSGGYLHGEASLVADSITNLVKRGIIDL